METTTLTPERGRLAFGPCVVEWTGVELTLANALVGRRWRVGNGLLYPLSLRDRMTGREWLARPADQPAPVPECIVPDEARTVEVTASHGSFGPVEAPSLIVELTATGPSLTLRYRLQVFAGAPGISVALSADRAGRTDPTDPTDDAPRATGQEGAAPANAAAPADLVDLLPLAPAHLRLVQVTLVDQTDIHNELVFENEWLLHPNEARVELAGNLFFVEDTLSEDGLIFLKRAPLPHARPVKSAADLRAHGGSRVVQLLGHGAGAEGGAGYPSVVLAYQGGASGRTAALHAYQRQVRPYHPGRDGLLLSNTWGDRSQDSRVCEAFMLREVEAGAAMGVDVIQIDDGWQKGKTVGSTQPGGVWEGFWKANPEFWQAHPERFPNGLAPVVAAARERGMQFGLWFAPDSSDDFVHWEHDAACILELHREHGIRYFKIDSVKMESKTAEANLRRFFDRLLRETKGEITFDLDVTAAVRPGYFGMMDVGPLFIENRYTEWRRYWPHQTLRNLWKLARYVDPLRLRMEFLNHTRNTHLYGEDPLAPESYAPAYLFAITMFANPLGWFEVSNLPEAYRAEVADLVRVWKEHRERIFRGRIYPIGETPDGTSWTGFLSVGEGDSEGYLLLFREVNDRPAFTTRLPMLPEGGYEAELLAGRGSAALARGLLGAEIPGPRQFLFARFTAA